LIMTMAYCGNHLWCFGYWRIWCGIQLYTKQPCCNRRRLCLYWLMELQVLDYTTTTLRNRTCGCYYWRQ
jgi:hypothetical protein